VKVKKGDETNKTEKKTINDNGFSAQKTNGVERKRVVD